MLTLHNISKHYQDHVALHNTTLTFAPGAFNVLLGPSGAGKSTLLRSCNLLAEPSTGYVEADGIGAVRSQSQSRQLRLMTACVFQQHQLILRQSVLTNVLNGRVGARPLWAGLLPTPRADIEDALRCLERVGLEDYALTRAGSLSGGQQQRVGIARALMQKPRILLADEPVASLDPTRAEEVLGLLHNICREDALCAVVSLHQVRFAKRFADRIIALRAGRVVFDGTPEVLTQEALTHIYAPQTETPLCSAIKPQRPTEPPVAFNQTARAS